MGGRNIIIQAHEVERAQRILFCDRVITDEYTMPTIIVQ